MLSGFLSGENTFLLIPSFPFAAETFSVPAVNFAGSLPFDETDTMRRTGEGLVTEAMVADGLREVGLEGSVLLVVAEGFLGASEADLAFVEEVNQYLEI